MIGILLPAPAVTAEAFADDDNEPCFPGEEHLIARAVPARRAEFVTARRCARQALHQLGFPPAPILPGPRREPCWPPGVVGSITHCRGYRAAAVTRATHLAGIGIDAEPHGPLRPGVAESISATGEVAMLQRLSISDPATHWDRVLFSAKESVYKAWFPLTRLELGFEDARLSFYPATRTFHAQITVAADPALAVLRGRYLVRSGFVVTAVLVPAAAVGGRP